MDWNVETERIIGMFEGRSEITIVELDLMLQQAFEATNAQVEFLLEALQKKGIEVHGDLPPAS